MLFPALTTYGSVLPGFWQPHPCSGICFYFHFFLKAAALRSGLPKAVPGGLLTRREGRASSGFFSGRSRSLWQLLFSKSQAPSPSAVPPHNGPPSRGSQGLRHCLVAMETPRSEKQPDASDHAEAAYSSLAVTGRIPRDVCTGAPAVPRGPFPALAGLPLASVLPQKDSPHRAWESQALPNPVKPIKPGEEKHGTRSRPLSTSLQLTLFRVRSQMSFAFFPSIPPRPPASLPLSWSSPL